MITERDAVLKRLSGQPAADKPLFLPDLTLWHKWHVERGTLPAGIGESLPDAARALGVPIWAVVRPWTMITPGIETRVDRTAEERTIRHITPHGVLTARWQLGPDGDWWQMEYPVKTEDDLPAAQALVNARQYVLKSDAMENAAQTVASDGVLALELPMQPFSDLLHTLLGWGEGLLLLAGHKGVIREMLAVLEGRLTELAATLADLPGDILLAPDNLDGQYISPRYFREYMAQGYRAVADVVRAAGKPLVVHVGGPIRRLLPLLAETGISAVEGIAGPPQSDASLAEARELAGPGMTLWGGIPQDFLLADRGQAEFEAAVAEAARQAHGDGRMILGVADRVPVNAESDRLCAIPGLLQPH